MKNLAAWWCGAAWALAARGAAGAGAALAGYVPANDVLQHSRIDLDLSDLDALLLAARWDDAGALYAGGRYSDKGQGKLRNLRAFSTDLEAKAKPLSPPLADFELFRSYYGRGDYADAFVQQELAQAGNSSLTGNVTLDTVARRELVIKAVQLQGVAMYVLYELAAAISKCSAKAAGASLNWDEGAAFYVGSLSAAPGASPTTGFSFYAFSNKRCIAFGTCGPDKVSVANRRAITAFSRGLALVAQGRCADAALQMAVVRKQLQVALLQGVLLYTQKASLGGTLKDRAEAWAMTRGLLPWLNSSSPRDAVTVSSIVSSALSGVVRGGQGNETSVDHAAILKAVYGAMGALCISCADLGVNAIVGAGPRCSNVTVADHCNAVVTSEAAEDSPPSQDAPKGGINVGLIVGLTVGLTLVLLALGVLVWKLSKVDESKASAATEPASAQAPTAESGTPAASGTPVATNLELGRV